MTPTPAIDEADRLALKTVSEALVHIRFLLRQSQSLSPIEREIHDIANLLHNVPRLIAERSERPSTKRLDFLIDDQVAEVAHHLRNRRLKGIPFRPIPASDRLLNRVGRLLRITN